MGMDVLRPSLQWSGVSAGYPPEGSRPSCVLSWKPHALGRRPRVPRGTSRGFAGHRQSPHLPTSRDIVFPLTLPLRGISYFPSPSHFAGYRISPHPPTSRDFVFSLTLPQPAAAGPSLSPKERGVSCVPSPITNHLAGAKMREGRDEGIIRRAMQARMSLRTPTVIPAHAGIQRNGPRRWRPWTPAFARVMVRNAACGSLGADTSVWIFRGRRRICGGVSPGYPLEGAFGMVVSMSQSCWTHRSRQRPRIEDTRSPPGAIAGPQARECR